MTDKPHPRTTPWRIAIMERLADGEWHDYQPLLAEFAHMVPPGQAYRFAETLRLEAGGPEKRRIPAADADIIRTGQRAVIRKTIGTIRKTGRLESEQSDTGRREIKRIRLNPASSPFDRSQQFDPERAIKGVTVEIARWFWWGEEYAEAWLRDALKKVSIRDPNSGQA